MNNDHQYLDHLRHSCAHLLAAAVMELWPDTKRTIGPAIENGFYYDFEFANPISESDLSKIEQKMRELVKKWEGFERKEVTIDEAKQLFANNLYKLELIDEFSKAGQTLTLYTSGNYVDLCRGGHSTHPKVELKHFKLLKIAGAYWRGDEHNTMLTRIYGTCWPTKEELDAYLLQQEEAKKRDHRKLGKELDLFVFSELVGPGLPLYTPKGALIRRLLQQFVGELQGSIGYEEAWTPQVTKADLFKVSGHYDKYKDDMFRVSSNYSDEEFFLKPMNCPMHAQIYASRPRSYRDLPIRICDYANLYRDEKPGELSGLTRLRAFSQDDGHCFCREDQIETEFTNVANIIKFAIAKFDMKYWIRLSLWDPNNREKYLGAPETWERSQATLEEIVKKLGVEYKKAEGEAAIYGPKMDFMAVDALGREWQISTIQLDFIQPQRFELRYTDQDGQLKQPVMIHRAILGSPERFLGLLIEHFAGAFPIWLSPIQAVVIPISQDQNEYARVVLNQLRAAGIRAENWNEAESMQNRIRKAEKQKIPYMLVVGKREEEERTVAIRKRGNKNEGSKQLEEFITNLRKEIDERAL
ncbi:threonine--tRNA ligase [Candidatus Cerribacteria bacterium 'Amazon FNV 2010 28 9']|uniref:Threonine--tRNA ligase n=1 Tax=Candidatus Cerribacteria bacterium 'Amazon FNV 2010 28 9' TaxID=2081795 RepID=A0A317JNZ8_9BACT|nr:MAG: threonine--tRNA ligase [Candidatus Cerribacteria bacterium 'Amazon FNV 2010 28 9']